MAITQTITQFPDAPNAGTDTPEEFSNKADAFVAHQSDSYVGEVNTWATQANSTASDVSSSANTAQLEAWNAEAEKMTADSYAVEPEDVFVKIYTSNGDGTFTATPTTDYSALHWASKSDASSIPAPVYPADEGYVLTARQTGMDWEEIIASGVQAISTGTGLDNTGTETVNITMDWSELPTVTTTGASDFIMGLDGTSEEKITVQNLGTVFETVMGWRNYTQNENIMIGVGQTWQEVTGSRDTGIEYTNNTTRPIEVSARCLTDSTSGYNVAHLVVDTKIVSETGGQGTNIYHTASAIVPAGSTYQLDVYGATIMQAWHELR